MTLRLARSFSLFLFFSVSLSLSRVFLLPGPAGPIICTIILSMFTPYYDSHHNDICETEIIGRAKLAHNPQTLADFFVKHGTRVVGDNQLVLNNSSFSHNVHSRSRHKQYLSFLHVT